MNRTEILRLKREEILINIAVNQDNRVKWIIALIDIDDEIAEIAEIGENERIAR